MHPLRLLSHTQQLLEKTLSFKSPVDDSFNQFWKKNPQCGAMDRQRIVHAIFQVLRYHARFVAWSKTAPQSLQQHPTWETQVLALLGLALGSQPKETSPDTSQGEQENFEFWHSQFDTQTQLWLQHCKKQHDGMNVALISFNKLPKNEIVIEEQFKFMSNSDNKLANLLEIPQIHTLPLWLAQRLAKQYPNDFGILCHALLQRAPLDLRVNLLKAKRESFLPQVPKELSATPTPYSPWGIRLSGKIQLNTQPAYEQGLIEVQDEGSQLLALLLQARRGEVIADFCAGAGGKTLAIGAMMRSLGNLYAFDTSSSRLKQLEPRLKKAGLTNVHLSVISSEKDPKLLRLRGKIDRILVDVPCSGTGTLRRHPELKHTLTEQSIEQFTEQQLQILQNASKLAKIGGRLVYSTCSLLMEENENIAQAFEAINSKNWRCLNAQTILEQAGIQSAKTLCNGKNSQYLRLVPHLHQTDGFFAAIWQRIS